MAKRKKIDWEAIEKEYIAGQLSIREIASRYDCSDAAIRKRAKRDGWERSLSDEVRRRTREKLVRSSVRANNITDQEIIEQASDRGKEVILLQRKDIAALRELETKLIAELDGNPTKLYITQYQGNIVQKEVALTAAERAQAANNLANVQHKRIQLERQAFNLNDASPIGEFDGIEITFVKSDKGQSEA